MNLIILHNNAVNGSNKGHNTLQSVVCGELPVNIQLGTLCEYHPRRKDGSRVCCDSRLYSNSNITALHKCWASKMKRTKSNVIYYETNLPISPAELKRFKEQPWLRVSNGRFATQVNQQSFRKRLRHLQTQTQADIIAVNVLAQLKGAHEKALIDPQDRLIGFRRFYDDSAELAPFPADWPHHLFIKTDILEILLDNMTLPLAFSKLIDLCSLNSLTLFGLNVGGDVLDLETEVGLWSFLTVMLEQKQHHANCIKKKSNRIPANAQVFGKVVLGENVRIADNSTIIGPTIIGDNVTIAPNAIIKTSVLGPNLSVPKGSFIQNQFLTGTKSRHGKFPDQTKTAVQHPNCTGLSFINNKKVKNNFRVWPKFSYVRAAKRIADTIASLIVLLLFIPVFPFIAIAIKLSSPGPVFFKDKRQGLHGREFFCLKFRTMILGADEIQENLRTISKVDGPQFKIRKDPRTTAVGKFLRDTFIDELPQFVNVVSGQMSIVGPRPSPEAENTTCAAWRDARLSVRPGITGLWQMRRTRRRDRDFQEWIYYDIEYVKNLSLQLDLSICWQTAKKLIANFLDQF
jgi:lipopolysaccharide/colanic/teichoic acid biosynthesis glycosyltransferase